MQRDWLERLASHFDPTRSKTKTNCNSLAEDIFPHFISAICVFYALYEWTTGQDCQCDPCDWQKWLLRHSIENCRHMYKNTNNYWTMTLQQWQLYIVHLSLFKTTPLQLIKTKVLCIAWGKETEFNIDSYIVHLSIFKTSPLQFMKTKSTVHGMRYRNSVNFQHIQKRFKHCFKCRLKWNLIKIGTKIFSQF